MRPELLYSATLESIYLNATRMRKEGFSPEGALLQTHIQALNSGIRAKNIERIQAEVSRRLKQRGYSFESPDDC